MEIKNESIANETGAQLQNIGTPNESSRLGKAARLALITAVGHQIESFNGTESGTKIRSGYLPLLFT